MINLLSPEEKKQQCRGRTIRIVNVALGFMLASIVIGIIFLLPSGVLSSSKKSAMAQQLEKTKATIAQRKEKNKGHNIETLQQTLTVLADEINTVRSAEIIQRIIDERPASISIDGFVFNHRQAIPTLTLTGTARNRDGLIHFAESLEKTTLFSRVDFPIRDLAQNNNIPFSLTLQLGSSATSTSPMPVISETKNDE